MNLIPCKCTNCGANMQVDESKDVAVCTFCGSSFLVERDMDLEDRMQEAADQYYGFLFDFSIRDGVLVKYNGRAEKVVIPNGVTHIKGAFKDCTCVKSVVLPESVTNIGNAAFYGCTNLTEITIPESVTNIGAYAFEGCKSLTSIKLPEKVSCIRLGTFINCSSLTSIVIPKAVTRIGDEAFRGCTELTEITVPDGLVEFGGAVFGNCGKLRQFVASEDWKRKHYQLHEALSAFAPKEKNMGPENGKSGGCYVATAVYGSYDCPQVWVLRRYRDDRLARSRRGRAFIKLYYGISPTLVKRFGARPWFRRLWRSPLDKLVQRLQAEGLADTPYQDRNW